MKKFAASLFFAGCLASSLLFAQTPAQQPCQEPQQKQLDFWVGEWALTWPGQSGAPQGHGSNSIKRVLDSCVVEESFSGEDSMHLRGRSVSIFDATSGTWKQTWVDNEGGYLDFSGGMKDGQMSFWREAKQANGSTSMQRMIWKNVTADSFDWSWENSKDGGKTWQVVWPIRYQRKK
jgi:hypothetical protein